MRAYALVIIFVLNLGAAHVQATTVPREPEEDNQEYLLDLVTKHLDPINIIKISGDYIDCISFYPKSPGF